MRSHGAPHSQVAVLREMRPQLDEIAILEGQCARASLEVDLAEEQVDAQKDVLAKAKAAGEAEAEAGAKLRVELQNERAAATAELEKVLVQLSSDPEMRQTQQAHENEKAEAAATAARLSDELVQAERAKHPRIRAVLLECTELPPYADAVRAATGLPVLDAITMVDFFHAAVSENPYFGIDWAALASTPAFSK